MKAHYDIDSGMIQIWLPDGRWFLFSARLWRMN